MNASWRAARRLAAVGLVALTAGCGPTAAEQHLMDQQKCAGFGYAAGSESFANCMMSVAQQRQAEEAAAQRAAAANAAAEQRQQAAIRAAQDQADKDAWDRRTGQGAYASSPGSSSSNPVDPIRDSITRDMEKMESGGSSQFTQGMNCTTTTTSSGSANNVTSTSQTNCH